LWYSFRQAHFAFMKSISFLAHGLPAFSAIMVLQALWGSAQVFTLDPEQSQVTISGSVLGGAITNQGPGSLTTKFAGTISVGQTGGSLQFLGASHITAQTNGSWQPKADGTAGSEPADFGGYANVGIAAGNAALRNILLDLISPPLTLNGGQFDSSSLTFFFPSNATSSLAYNVTGLFSKQGVIALSGYATNKITALSSLSSGGGQPTLTIPVDATYYFKALTANDTVIRLQGQLVAVQSGAASLQVQSFAVQQQSLLLQWQGAPGTQFQIQSSTDLLAWRTNDTVVTPASGSYTWTGGISGPVQFFRLAK
jgi:hypothetical protein